MVSTQVRWDTHTTAVGTAAPPLHPFDGSVVILFRVYLHRIGHIISINSVLDTNYCKYPGPLGYICHRRSDRRSAAAFI